MTWVDYAALAVIAVSVVVSLLRGAVREIMSLVSWVASFWIAIAFSPALARLMPASLAAPSLRLFVAFGAILFLSLLLFGLLSLGLGALVQRGGLTATDRSLGVLFGLLRGVVILIAVALLAGLTTLPRERAWRDSLVGPPLQSAALSLVPYLPKELAQRLHYD